MRFINCPNCLSTSHTDDRLERESSSQGGRRSPHRKFGRLHTFTKALFSPNRFTFNASESNGFTCCMKNNTPTAAGIDATVTTPRRANSNINSSSDNINSTSDEMASQSPPPFKYRLERKHKIKKRDLVKPKPKREPNALTGKSCRTICQSKWMFNSSLFFLRWMTKVKKYSSGQLEMLSYFHK